MSLPTQPRAAGSARAMAALWAAARLQQDTAPCSRSLAFPLSPLPSIPPPDGASPADPLPAEPLQPGDVPGRDVERLGLPRVAPRQKHGCLLIPSVWMGRGHG